VPWGLSFGRDQAALRIQVRLVVLAKGLKVLFQDAAVFLPTALADFLVVFFLAVVFLAVVLVVFLAGAVQVLVVVQVPPVQFLLVDLVLVLLAVLFPAVLFPAVLFQAVLRALAFTVVLRAVVRLVVLRPRKVLVLRLFLRELVRAIDRSFYLLFLEPRETAPAGPLVFPTRGR
jgi:hypothetical protein